LRRKRKGKGPSVFTVYSWTSAVECALCRAEETKLSCIRSRSDDGMLAATISQFEIFLKLISVKLHLGICRVSVCLTLTATRCHVVNLFFLPSSLCCSSVTSKSCIVATPGSFSASAWIWRITTSLI